MSKVIESVKRIIQNEDPKPVYDTISHELSQTYDQYMGIEFLPPEFEPELKGAYFFKENHFLALSKLRIIQAFIVARRILNQHLNQPGSVLTDDVWKATNVLLLWDSEHLTAANTRKRLILNSSLTETERKEVLEKDAYFINSLLSSDLYRHTKSPVLWAHKRWLFRQERQAQMPVNLVQDFESVIHLAADRHPMNYYAWSYARSLFSSRSGEWDPETVQRFVEMSHKWCRLHLNDTSGWSFLIVVAAEFPQHAKEIFQETATLAKRYGWRGEAIWNFLRTLVLLPVLRENTDVTKGFHDLYSSVRGEIQDGTSWDATVLDRCAKWVDTAVSRGT